MVFQRPNPFPKSIFDNVAYGPRVHGIRNRAVVADLVEESLRRAALWDEVKDHLKKSALSLSGGQQQRLCIARALAVRPTVLLMDEPCSALDPKATDRIEQTTRELARELTVVIVTHNLQQAGRISDHVAVLLAEGVLAEFGDTKVRLRQPVQRAGRGLPLRPLRVAWRTSKQQIGLAAESRGADRSGGVTPVQSPVILVVLVEVGHCTVSSSEISATSAVAGRQSR